MQLREELFLLLIFLLTYISQLVECQWGGGGGSGRHWRGRGRGGNCRKFGREGGGGGGDYDDSGTIKIVIKDNLEGDRVRSGRGCGGRGRGGRGRGGRSRGGRGSGPPDDFRLHPGGPHHRPHGAPHEPPKNRPPNGRPPNLRPELDSLSTESENYALSESEWRRIEP